LKISENEKNAKKFFVLIWFSKKKVNEKYAHILIWFDSGFGLVLVFISMYTYSLLFPPPVPRLHAPGTPPPRP
jgi:hypothetical protein